MRLLPVIDILRGRVVRARQGRRETYQPWCSPLTAHGDPGELAECLGRHFGWREAYVADLDALAGDEPQFATLAQIVDHGLRLWLDAGTHTIAQLQRLQQFHEQRHALAAVILPLEALASPADLERLVPLAGPELSVFSLDLHQGRVWSRSPAWQTLSVAQIASIAWNLGVRRFIALDVARVGTGGGPGTLDLCRELKSRWPAMELVAGGGVQGKWDIQALEQAGCDRVLVASALHDGRVTALEVLQNGW